MRSVLTLTIFLILLASSFGCLLTSSDTVEPGTSDEKATTTTLQRAQSPSPTTIEQQREPKKRDDKDVALIEEIHLNMDEKDIPDLKKIIVSHSDPYVRERAIYVLTDLSLENGGPTDTIDFLKEVALKESDADVRTSAYVNLDIIRSTVPADVPGRIDVRVEGDLVEGGVAKIFLKASSDRDADGKMGLKRLAQLDREDDVGISFEGRNPVNFDLKAGEESVEFPFEISLDEQGEYIVLVVLRLSVDAVDYGVFEKGVYLKVGEPGGSGSYDLIEPPLLEGDDLLISLERAGE